MNKKKYLLFSFLMLITFSCGNDDMGGETDEDIISVEEGRRMQVAELYDSQITILQQKHIDLLEIFVDESENFASAPSAASLALVQQTWKNAFLHWKSAEIYNLGAIQSSFIHTRIHQWPVNTRIIEANISGAQSIDNKYISSTGANVKGYGAIEYLLFHDTDAAVLLEFTTSENKERRLQYVVSLVENLKEQSDVLRVFWTDTETTFKENLETGVNGSQNRVVNALIAALESIKRRKIEEALNTESLAVEQLEAFRSAQSKEAIAANLSAIYNTYLGDFENNNNFGLSEYAIEVLNRQDLDKAIREAFRRAFDDLEAIDGSLESALISNVDLIESLRVSIQEIIAIFKTDFSSAANIVVTFNDNDGD
ncbi:imelysin family protein [Maribacter sp. ACAM166]|uniref:imelysin family protein n=1 Tax=Maribacter sp. ACAM166 TaxID=2508996 RepID=UPI0010FF5A05|nr:imelysin family protein [Maribacter sp. ACAM166]TLP81880.1 hypothetical protein ES765_04165 [Maribacter sp. ACAM166]